MLSNVLKDAKSPRYDILYVTLGANTRNQTLVFQQLPSVIRNSKLRTLAVHVSPTMKDSLHITDGMEGTTVNTPKHNHKKFVSGDKKLHVHYFSMWMEPHHVELLSKTVLSRSENGLKTVIADFLFTGPYTPFSNELTIPLAPLLLLPYVSTVPNAKHDKGIAKSTYESIVSKKQSSKKTRYTSAPNWKYRVHSRLPSSWKSHQHLYVDITGNTPQNGYVSRYLSKPKRYLDITGSSPISLSP